MPISRVFVTRFFQLVTDRRFAEAERILERLKLKVQETEWNKGYFQALQGIILAKRSNNDQYVFLSNINPNDEDEFKTHRREFLTHAKNRLHADYDRGFFSAWADYMRVQIKLKDAERKDAKMKTKRLARSNQEKTLTNKPTQAVFEEKTMPKKIIQTKLG